MATELGTPSKSAIWKHRKCLILCCIVASANMQSGFDSAAVGALQAMPGFLKVFGYEDPKSPMGYGIDSTVQRLISSLITVGSFVSSLAAGLFSSHFGRRHALWLACTLNAAACAVMIAATTPGVLYLGRLFLGFANGFFMTFSSIYAAEAAPAEMRGLIVALYAFFVNMGAILGSVIDNATKSRMDKGSYQIPIAALFVVPTFLAVGLIWVPESPRWLLHRGKENQARRSLQILRGDALTLEEFELEWREIVRGVEDEKRTAKSVGLLAMFRGVDLRRTLLCYATIASQAGTGLWFIAAYSTYYFAIAGVSKPFEYSIMMTCLGFAASICGMYALHTSVGRRPILIYGSLACALFSLAPGIAHSVSPHTPITANVVVAFTVLFMCAYNASVSPASYVVATELVNSRLRAWTVGSATALGHILAWLTSFTTPYFINPADLNWGPQYMYIWAASNFIFVVFFYLFLPEMKNRSLEELDIIFEAKILAREFKEYKVDIIEINGVNKREAGGETDKSRPMVTTVDKESFFRASI
ncbi:general substrate transporter [Aaosphaeria arxii CBS 175.79]|uniref:General substrate transporter n=1 Tax=Aaosphaeria arxii CBS 175.79 TaxID=1450172 RepID=A0A6A5X739_9PLEO|nr:general substrate transporter [Aaosphaeria arxii CBS 175.79]KAF2008730.1 general substrate transporter [Aaosphaeria arxii CBS 175.79]